MSRRLSRSRHATSAAGAWFMFGLLAICLAITSVTGARADEPEPAGVWVTERGSDRLFLVLYADGRYRMARARAAARAPLAVQWDDGTFAVGAGWVTLTAQPAACKSRLEGHFQFRFVGRYLRLEGPQQAFTFGRLPERNAPLTASAGPAVFGCFEGDRFIPTASRAAS